MTSTANLGFPRIGAQRELKKALERYWKGEIPSKDLHAAGAVIRAENWKRQHKAGITHIPSGDFTYYDHVLNHSYMFGAIPERYQPLLKADALDLYFAMARGYQKDGI
jgi:5-methyltetrahydropteroyltriglutamate--homocysteine methyltransferase